MVLDITIALKAVTYQLDIAAGVLIKSYETNPAEIDLTDDGTASTALFNHARLLHWARGYITQLQTIPSGAAHSATRGYISDALDAYSGFVASTQIDGNKATELAAIAETKTAVEAIT